MVKITHVEAKPDFVLSLTFDDGVKGEVSIADLAPDVLHQKILQKH